jgi:hypothetical protein
MLEYSSREVLNMAITSEERLEYIKNWQKENKDKIKERRMKLSVSFNAETESHYIEVFRSIPNKAEFFRKCLDDYEKEQRR